MDFDAVVIGAGVVGAAVAARLAVARPDLIVLDRSERAGSGVTSRNSGVVHAGIHHPPEWAKTRLCVAGRRMLYAYAERRGVPYARTGKLVVAQDEAERRHLEQMLERGRIARAGNLELLDADALRRVAPDVRGIAALSSPESGIVDAHALTDALLADATDRGATIALGQRVREIAREPGGYLLEVESVGGGLAAVSAEVVINAGGLDADLVAAAAGIDIDAAGYRQRFAKGDYWSLAPRHSGRLKQLVYPVPPKDLAGLGIHLTLDLHGALCLGPDVVWLADREECYAVDATRGDLFFDAARRYLPWLERSDLTPDRVGIRPKLSGPGQPARDFVLCHEIERDLEGFVNLIGIESPGLTAALAIAKEVERLLPSPPPR